MFYGHIEGLFGVTSEHTGPVGAGRSHREVQGYVEVLFFLRTLGFHFVGNLD